MSVSIKVTLHVKEIIYDIQNKTYLTGRAVSAAQPDAYEAASNIQASGSPEDDYQITRSIADYFTKIKSLLGEYLDEDKSETDNLIIDKIQQRQTLNLVFSLPDNFNNASVDSLGKGIHAYIVDGAVYDWFMITNKNDAQSYYDHAQLSLETVKRSLYKRSRPVNPNCTSSDNCEPKS